MDGRNGMFTHASSESSSKQVGKNGLSRRDTDDHDLKDKLSDVFDAVLEVKEVIGTLRDENAELRKQLDTQAALKWDTDSKLYFFEGDPDPFCPVCRDFSGKQIRLHPDQNYNRAGYLKYECRVCSNSFVTDKYEDLRRRKEGATRPDPGH